MSKSISITVGFAMAASNTVRYHRKTVNQDNGDFVAIRQKIVLPNQAPSWLSTYGPMKNE